MEINTNYKEGDTYLHSENSQNLLSSNQLLYKLKDYSYYHQKFDRTLDLITDTKSYVPLSSCVLEHILATTNLTNFEKLYYILADSLAVINKNQGGSRSCALPSEDWADRLGCSRSLVFTMQESLVKKGYFIINKDFDEIIEGNKKALIEVEEEFKKFEIEVCAAKATAVVIMVAITPATPNKAPIPIKASGLNLVFNTTITVSAVST